MSDVERLRAAGGVQPAVTGVRVCVNAHFAMACRVRAGAERDPLPRRAY